MGESSQPDQCDRIFSTSRPNAGRSELPGLWCRPEAKGAIRPNRRDRSGTSLRAVTPPERMLGIGTFRPVPIDT